MSSDSAATLPPGRPKNRPDLKLNAGEEQVPRLSDTSEESTKSLKLRVHGTKTDVVHGRSLAFSFGMTALCGIGTLLLSVYIYLDNTGHYQVGMAFVQGIGGFPSWWHAIVFFPLVSGLVVTILSILMLSFSLLTTKQAEQFERNVEKTFGKNSKRDIESKFGGCNKCLVYVIKFMVLSAVAIQVTVSILALDMVNKVDKSIHSGDLQDIENGTMQALTLAFGLTTFNECCSSRGWTQQGSIPACPETDCTVPPEFQLYQSSLCTCYYANTEEEARYVEAIRSEEVCKLLEEATVGVVDETIPGSALSIKSVITADEVVLVGDYSLASQGCGLGFGLGFSYLTYKWMEGYVRPIVIALLVLSFLELAFCLYGIYTNWVGVHQAIVDEKLRLEEEEERRQRALKSPMGRIQRGLSLSFFSPGGGRKPNKENAQVTSFQLDP